MAIINKLSASICNVCNCAFFSSAAKLHKQIFFRTTMQTQQPCTYKMHYLGATKKKYLASIHVAKEHCVYLFASSTCDKFDLKSAQIVQTLPLNSSHLGRRFDEFAFFNPYLDAIIVFKEKQCFLWKMNSEEQWQNIPMGAGAPTFTCAVTNLSVQESQAIVSQGIEDDAMVYGTTTNQSHTYKDLSMFHLDMKTMVWSKLVNAGKINLKNRWMFGVGIAKQTLVLHGGENSTRVFNDTWFFNTHSQYWTQCNTRGELAMMPDMTCVIDQNKMLITGSYRWKPTMRILDLDTLIWKDLYPTNTTTLNVASLSVNGALYPLARMGRFLVVDLNEGRVMEGQLEFEISFVSMTKKLKSCQNESRYCDIKIFL